MACAKTQQPFQRRRGFRGIVVAQPEAQALAAIMGKGAWWSVPLAVLIGVNVGPNLTYVGSLATLLWRRIVQAHDHETPIQEFTLLGLLATPLAIIVGVVALWGSLLLIGGS